MMAMVAGTAPLSRHDLLNLSGEIQVLGVGHTVAEYGALKGHDGLPGVEGGLDFGLDVKIFFKIGHYIRSL